MLHKKVAKHSPGLYTKQYILKSHSKSSQRIKRRLFTTPVYNKKKSGPDEHYGAVADIETSPDMSKEAFCAKKIMFLSQVNVSEEQIKQIEKGTYLH